MNAAICCSVTRPASRGQESVVCDDHRAKGWGVYQTWRGSSIVDRARTYACGCVRTSIEQQQISTCARHAIGPRACCENAERIVCVCADSYRCTEHGEVHYGTHD